MKTLIVEDDYITSQVVYEIMTGFGEADIAEDGRQAIDKFKEAYSSGDPFELILLDIMMPEMDGQEVLKQIRQFEEDNQVKGLDGVNIIMATALSDFDNLRKAFSNQCEGYIIKPIEKDKIVNMLMDLDLLPQA